MAETTPQKNANIARQNAKRTVLVPGFRTDLNQGCLCTTEIAPMWHFDKREHYGGPWKFDHFKGIIFVKVLT